MEDQSRQRRWKGSLGLVIEDVVGGRDLGEKLGQSGRVPAAGQTIKPKRSCCGLERPGRRLAWGRVVISSDTPPAAGEWPYETLSKTGGAFIVTRTQRDPREERSIEWEFFLEIFGGTLRLQKACKDLQEDSEGYENW